MVELNITIIYIITTAAEIYKLFVNSSAFDVAPNIFDDGFLFSVALTAAALYNIARLVVFVFVLREADGRAVRAVNADGELVSVLIVAVLGTAYEAAVGSSLLLCKAAVIVVGVGLDGLAFLEHVLPREFYKLARVVILICDVAYELYALK